MAALAAGLAIVPRDAAAQAATRGTSGTDAPLVTAAPRQSVTAATAAPVEMSDAEVIERTSWIERRFDAEAPAAGTWFRFWVLGSAAVTVGYTVLASAVDDPTMRPSFVVGGITAAISTISMLAVSPGVYAGSEPMRALPGATPAERRERLRASEAMLRRAAAGENFGRSWLVQVGTFAVAIAGSLVLWLGYDQGVRALINFGSVMLFGELRFFTQPTGLTNAQRAYEAGNWRPRAATSLLRIAPAPVVFPGATVGLGLTGTF